MQHADKERLPILRPPAIEKAADEVPAAKKPATTKPDWIEHCDWNGEGVVGDSHTD